MKMKRTVSLFAALFTAAIFFAGGMAVAQGPNEENTLVLKDGWQIQSSAETKLAGAEISSTGFDAAGWHVSAVPTTVLSALVQDGTFKDIYFGTNLEGIPTPQFAHAWWFRDELAVSAAQAGECASLVFEGINYRANVWLNGERIAKTNETFGAFRIFSLDVTGRLKSGKNVLAVEIFPPQPGDFTMGFVDWNPKPPDKNMGLFRPVKLHFYQTVAVENVFVESRIDHETWKKAELTVCADVSNHSREPVKTTLEGELEGARFSEAITLQPGEKRAVKLTPEKHPQLKLDSPRLWWPWELGEPALHTLTLQAIVGGAVADRQSVRFGIREVADFVDAEGHRGYTVNGKRMLIRGGGWADELLLHEAPANLAAQIAYTKGMNLNTIRLEGIWGSSQQLYDLADENGLLIMVGWSCQWEWAEQLGKKCDKKYGGFMSETDMQLATNYLRDQVFWLRNHPGIFVWVLGSDMLPNPELEARLCASSALT